jgi:hypothetical protein
MVPFECVWGWNRIVDLTDCESRHTTTVHGISAIRAYIYLKHILLDTVCTWRIGGKNSPLTQFNSIRNSCQATPLSDANVSAGHRRCTQESVSKFFTLVNIRSRCCLHYIDLYLSMWRKIGHRTSFRELVRNRFVRIMNYSSYLQKPRAKECHILEVVNLNCNNRWKNWPYLVLFAGVSLQIRYCHCECFVLRLWGY